MIEISDWLWECLYAIKQLYDHGKADELLDEWKDNRLDSDDIGEISMRGLYCAFEETVDDWQSWDGTDIYVYFDPVLDEFYRLCLEYEQTYGLTKESNPFRQTIGRAISSALNFDDYSYEYIVYDGSQRDGRCKIVLKLFPDFCHLYEVTGGLLELYDAYCSQTKRIKQELSGEVATDVIALSDETHEKEGGRRDGHIP